MKRFVPWDAELTDAKATLAGGYTPVVRNSVFERYGEYARYVTEWTNALLRPPPPHVLQILGVAGQNPAVARRFANGFTDPTDFRHWFMDPALWEKYLAEV